MVRVESVEGADESEGLVWTTVVEADSRRRLRLDYEMVEVERPDRLSWEHRLEGTVFGSHLARQATELTIRPSNRGAIVGVTLIGELRGAARLAGPSLKSDQKKLLAEALDRLRERLEGAR